MSRTYKDKPSRLVWQEQSEDETLRDFLKHHKLSKTEEAFIRKFWYKPEHGRLMRTFAGAYCSNRNCCKKKPSGGERQRENTQWRKEVWYV